MLSQYQSWYAPSAPLDQMTDTTQSSVLAEQAAWAAAQTAGTVTATDTNGTVTVTNNGSSAIKVPVTVPAGTEVNGAAFGTPYGGELSDWTSLAGGASVVLSVNNAPTITSAASANSIVGTSFSFGVTTTGSPAAAITETGALPNGVTFVDNGNGTATLSGTATSGTGGSYPITITATNATGSATQSFTLTNAEAPTITSATTASFTTGVASTYTVTTTGFPAATITESGTLPAGLSFTDNGNGTATITGSASNGSAGTYPVSISATNVSASTATLPLSITVSAAAAPAITTGSTAFFILNTSGSFAVTATGSPTAAITESGPLPAGLTFVDQGNGTAIVSGTPTSTGTTVLDVTAANAITPDATQSL
jgi:hypothetical protein